MKRLYCISLALAAAIAPLSGATGSVTFDRYSVILDRKPFGLPPPPPEAAAAAAVPQDSFTTYVRLTAMVQQDGGDLRVGFVDKKQKDRVYMLGVGDKADDYEVLEADLPSELAKIRKGAEEQWLSMKVPGAVSPPAKRDSSGDAGNAVRISDVRPGPPAVGPPAVNPPGTPLNLAGLRRQTRYAAIRRAEIEKEKQAEQAKKLGVFREPPEGDEEDADEAVATPQKTPPSTMIEEKGDDEDDSGEVVVTAGPPDPTEDDSSDEDEAVDEDEVIREAEIQAHLQNYQKELIRQGLPPLPIKLTPQTDAELVKEGVLPPTAAVAVADDDDDDDDDADGQ